MSNSVQTVVSDGSLTLLDISFNYFDRAHVHVYFDNVEQSLGTTWSWVGTTDKKVQFSPAVADDVVVKVQRITPLASPRHVYSSPGNAPFNKSTVDENFRQTLYAAQEAQEGASLEQLQRDLDAQGNKITDLGDAALDGDAISLKMLREYLPYGPAAASLNSRIAVEEAQTAALAGQYGSGLVGAATYAQLRAYTGDSTRMQIGGRDNYFDNAHGVFVRTGAAADDDGVVLRDALGRSWVRQYVGGVDIRWWGAKGGNYNSSPALQAAYSYLVSTGNGGVILVPPAPDGYRLDTPLDFTDEWVPITIKGMSGTNIPSNRPNNFPYGSLFWANTGGVCIDIAGRCNFGLEDIVIDTFDTTKCPTPSRIGVLGARTTTSQDNQNHHFKNVAIFMKSQRPGAPSIAHYAYGTELGIYENCWYFADVPAAYCLANVLSVTSPHRTLVSSGVSATANTANGCRFVTLSPSDPAIWFDGTYDNSFKQSYFYNESGVFANRPALLLTGNNHSLSVDTFQCEEFANVFEQYGSLFNSTIKGFVTSTSYATVASEIGRFTGAAITVDNEFEIETGGIGVAYEAYKGTTAASSVFANNKFKLNQTGSFNVSFGAGSNVGNLHFDKWTDDASVLLGGITNSTNITVNGKQKTIGAVNVSDGFVLKYEAKPNNTANSILSFTVPNGDIAYCYFLDYVINSSAKEVVKTGRVHISVARKTGQSMVLTASKLYENDLQVSGAETLGVTFAVSGVFDPATGTQYAFLTCNANSSVGGTSYIRGSVVSLGSSLLNTPIYGTQNIVIGTV